MKICPIILSGGAGTRLWPLSRTLFPKQFLNLVSDQSLFVDTVSRVSGLDLETLPPLVVCNEAHRFLVAQQLQEGGFKHSGILLEPCGKNTAPAIMLAAAHLKKRYAEDVLMLVLPADHVIHSVAAFQDAVAKAKYLSSKRDIELLNMALKYCLKLLRSKPINEYVLEIVDEYAIENDSEKYIVDNVHSGYHLIGGSHDAIDSNFEVHNTKGLYVCDASVFKTHVSSNTHASVVLLSDIFSKFFIINNFDG